MQRRVSIKDIARQVGCSMAAVSKVLNDSRGSTVVGAELREPSGPESGETALRYLAQGRVNVLVGAPARMS